MSTYYGSLTIDGFVAGVSESKEYRALSANMEMLIDGCRCKCYKKVCLVTFRMFRKKKEAIRQKFNQAERAIFDKEVISRLPVIQQAAHYFKEIF